MTKFHLTSRQSRNFVIQIPVRLKHLAPGINRDLETLGFLCFAVIIYLLPAGGLMVGTITS